MIEKNHKENMTTLKLLYEDFFPALCVFANRFIQDESVAKDIVQDAFLYCWTKKIDVTSSLAAKSYLFKYVRNRSLNYLRDSHVVSEDKIKTKMHPNYFRDLVIEEETYQLIYEAIKLLPPKGKSVIEMTLDGLKNHEIAKKMGVSVNTVKTTKKRAFNTLRSELKENVFSLLVITCEFAQREKHDL